MANEVKPTPRWCSVVSLLALLVTWFGSVPRGGAAEAGGSVDAGTGAPPLFPCGTVSTKSQGLAQLKSAGPGARSAIGEKRILLYRVDFSNYVGAAISTNVAVALISNLNSFYREMSCGLMTFAPVGAGSVVTDTLRLPKGSSAYDAYGNVAVSFSNLLADTRQAAADAGYAPAAFDFDIICTGTQPGAVFGGIANVGGPGLWIANNNFNSIGVAGHELGHNLGLSHASFWYTGDQSATGPGVKQEYGDPFDTMGTPGGNTSHFNARYKNLLGWIPDADAPLITANGTYRMAAHDLPTATGVRALHVPRSSSQDYWIEFRQSFNNRWMTNGVGLRWAGHDATNTLLLDTTPGTPSATQDSPVLIGRTFSDRCLDLHITPIRKLGTTPETLEVVVNRGPFPSNLPPVLAIMPIPLNVPTGAVVTLQAAAADPNGDALAYSWDFGDSTFGGNQPSLPHVWTKDGEYVVHCTVTDMKGGTASASTVVRAGTVTTFLVTGRVLKYGLPVEGVLVRAGPLRFGYTDSDGTYRISQLTAGRQTMTALLEQHNVFNSGFENPVTVGPNAAGLDFAALPDSLNAITLVATNSVWKYLDTGAAPASGWTGLGYDDSAWAAGPAKLGYGVGNVATPVNSGTNDETYITTWFRHAFAVEDSSVVNHVVFRLRRDDGAVVYLNGNEVYRENMPSGVILDSTAALGDVSASEEQTLFKRLTLPTGLVTGPNMLAVEIHQTGASSTDLSFELELVGMSENPDALRPPLSWQRVGGQVQLSWPANYNGWSLCVGRDLTPSAWPPSTAPVTFSDGWSSMSLFPSNSSGFYQLRKPGFCAPFP